MSAKKTSGAWRQLNAAVIAVSLLAGCAAIEPKPGGMSPTAPPEETPQSYMRVGRNPDGAMDLLIAVRRFVPDKNSGPVVWLAGVTHIGEKEYYDELQERLDKSPLVLFEGVNTGKTRESRRRAEMTQGAIAEALGLEFQLDAIDYDRPNFRNSDMSVKDLKAVFSKRKDKLGAKEFAMLSSAMDAESLLGKTINLVVKLVGASAKGRAMTKITIIETLAAMGDDPERLPGCPEGMKHLMKILIEKRNQKVVDDLKTEIDSGDPPRSICLLYGAGHMTDMEKRLCGELGYQPDGQFWLPAISVNPEKAGISNAELKMLRMMMAYAMSGMKSGGNRTSPGFHGEPQSFE